jgi:hypothetical protein
MIQGLKIQGNVCTLRRNLAAGTSIDARVV